MKHNYESYLQKKHFLNLDGLRGISIMLVIWHHAENHATVPLNYGFLGVDLFFIISGFLIVTLLLREKRKTNDILLKSFYVRRFLRIFPLYYASLFLIFIYAFLAGSQAIFTSIFTDFPKAFFYVSNWFPMVSMLSITWSLSAEEQFYSLWPWVEKYAQKYVVFFLGLLLLVLIGIQVFHQFGFLQNTPSFLAEASFTPIFLGVGLAHLLDSEKSYNVVSSIFSSPWAPVTVLLMLSGLFYYSISDISGIPRLIFHLCFTALVAISVVKEQSLYGSFLQWKPLARIGVVSYGMYLLHLIALHLVNKISKFSHIDFLNAKFIGTLFLTWAMAEISYRYYETPFLNLKKKWEPPFKKTKTEK